MSVGEIAAHFKLTQPTISHHLGLAQKKGRYVYYSVNRCCLEACARRLIEPFVDGILPGDCHVEFVEGAI